MYETYKDVKKQVLHKGVPEAVICRQAMREGRSPAYMNFATLLVQRQFQERQRRKRRKERRQRAEDDEALRYARAMFSVDPAINGKIRADEAIARAHRLKRHPSLLDLAPANITAAHPEFGIKLNLGTIDKSASVSRSQQDASVRPLEPEPEPEPERGPGLHSHATTMIRPDTVE